MTNTQPTPDTARLHTVCAMVTAACAVLMMTGATYDFLTAETFPIWTLCGAGLVIASRDIGHWLIRRNHVSEQEIEQHLKDAKQASVDAVRNPISDWSARTKCEGGIRIYQEFSLNGSASDASVRKLTFDISSSQGPQEGTAQ